MKTRNRQAGIYGFVNGLGYRGDPATKQKLIRRTQRAADCGDWETILEMGLAYLVGAGVGAYVNERLAGNRSTRW